MEDPDLNLMKVKHLCGTLFHLLPKLMQGFVQKLNNSFLSVMNDVMSLPLSITGRKSQVVGSLEEQHMYGSCFVNFENMQN
jgi:hypothetical protein